jgi:hypothetical protein
MVHGKAVRDATRPTRGVRFLVVLGALVATASCGSNGTASSGSSTSRAVAPLTKAAYIAKANAICATMNARTRALGRPGPDVATAIRVGDESAAIAAQALRRLRALPAPPADAAALERIYSKVDAVIADYPRVSAALRTGRRAAIVSAATQLGTDGRAANAASNSYGLTVCGG